MPLQVGLIAVAAALVLSAGVLSGRRIRSLRDREALNGNRRALVRDVALVAGAFCAVAVVATVTALGLR